jgi:tetratricopeptide (TPR) repeat protein
MVAEALEDDTLIPSQINKYYNSQQFAAMDPMVLSRINFYVGLLLYRQEKYGEALAFLQAVDQKASVYAKALFLEGIIHIRLGVRYNLARDEARTQAEHNKAIGLFEKIVGLSGREEAKAKQAMAAYDNILRLWQLCTLNLARSYYGKGDFSKAVMFYARIPKFSQDWADALFEIGWAHFMREEYGKALGALHTLHSPRFEFQFAPESWILKATIYFHVCLYEEARAALDYFNKHYEKILPGLKALLDRNPPNEHFASLLLKDTLEPNDPMAKVPVTVRNGILSNPRVENFRHFLRSLEAEAVAIEQVGDWQGSRLKEELAGVVSVQRNLIVKTAGGFVKAHLLRQGPLAERLPDHPGLHRPRQAGLAGDHSQGAPVAQGGQVHQGRGSRQAGAKTRGTRRDVQLLALRAGVLEGRAGILRIHRTPGLPGARIVADGGLA